VGVGGMGPNPKSPIPNPHISNIKIIKIIYFKNKKIQ
jgi:hypothetical protein